MIIRKFSMRKVPTNLNADTGELQPEFCRSQTRVLPAESLSHMNNSLRNFTSSSGSCSIASSFTTSKFQLVRCAHAAPVAPCPNTSAL